MERKGTRQNKTWRENRSPTRYTRSAVLETLGSNPRSPDHLRPKPNLLRDSPHVNGEVKVGWELWVVACVVVGVVQSMKAKSAENKVSVTEIPVQAEKCRPVPLKVRRKT